MYSEQNSNTFLSLYNQIDKLFDQVLMLTRYVPFNEKIQMFLEESYDISPIVKKYQQKLRYFGDLRNQIVHGFRLDNQHFVIASDHAVEQIEQIYDHLAEPKTIVEMFGAEGVITCQMSDRLVEVIERMREESVSHIPVYDDSFRFVDILDESTIVHRIGKSIAGVSGLPPLETICLHDMDLSQSNDEYDFVAATMSVYQLRDMFIKDFSQDNKKRLSAVLVTQGGKRSEPLLALVTVLDLPKLEEYFIS